MDDAKQADKDLKKEKEDAAKALIAGSGPNIATAQIKSLKHPENFSADEKEAAAAVERKTRKDLVDTRAKSLSDGITEKEGTKASADSTHRSSTSDEVAKGMDDDTGGKFLKLQKERDEANKKAIADKAK